jgi:hypothetical protein
MTAEQRMRASVFAIGMCLAGSASAQQAAAPHPGSGTDAPTPEPVSATWKHTVYGFVQAHFIHDSTQSFTEVAGNTLIARGREPAGRHGRTTFSARGSRVGLALSAPELAGIRTSAVLEVDFYGSQPATASEAQLFTSPLPRLRHAMMKFQSAYVDVLVGQYWHLFGWQGAFHPSTVEVQGLPGQVFGRAPQLRVSRTFAGDLFTCEVAVAASRPPQRDAWAPDAQGGVRLLVNEWKGLRTAGATSTTMDALALGVSGVARRIFLREDPVSQTRTRTATGWGISIDALLPIIPAAESRRGNSLTANASFVVGTGIADLYTGLTHPPLFDPESVPASPSYASSIDPGIAVVSSDEHLHTIDWRSYSAGLQYYLPPSGTIWISANYTHLQSNNVADYATEAAKARIFTRSDWADANLFWAPVEPLRVGLEYSWFSQRFADRGRARNHRFQLATYYVF